MCLRKAHYAANRLGELPGVSLRFRRPFFKEFAVQVPAKVDALLGQLRADGYHAGLPLGRWYPELANSLNVAVTEKRTKAEIDGLASALGHRLTTNR